MDSTFTQPLLFPLTLPLSAEPPSSLKRRHRDRCQTLAKSFSREACPSTALNHTADSHTLTRAGAGSLQSPSQDLSAFGISISHLLSSSLLSPFKLFSVAFTSLATATRATNHLQTTCTCSTIQPTTPFITSWEISSRLHHLVLPLFRFAVNETGHPHQSGKHTNTVQCSAAHPGQYRCLLP